MQGLSLEMPDGSDLRIACPGRYLEPAAVNRITDQRIMDMSHMNADLVGPPGFKFYPQQGVVREALGDTVMGNGGFTFFADGEPLPVGTMPTDRLVHRSAGRQSTLHQSQVFPMHGPRLKLVH